MSGGGAPDQTSCDSQLLERNFGTATAARANARERERLNESKRDRNQVSARRERSRAGIRALSSKPPSRSAADGGRSYANIHQPGLLVTERHDEDEAFEQRTLYDSPRAAAAAHGYVYSNRGSLLQMRKSMKA